jgi:Flp pilus assembly protein TadD
LEQAIVRGSELLKQGQLAEAQLAFHRAHELDPESTKVLALLGLSYFRANQFAEARPIYEELVGRAATDASHRLNLGLVYLKLGQGDLAIAALEASRALDPSQGRAISYLGLAYARAGRYVEAYRSFLMAGQVELAAEIEVNLPPAAREEINAQLGRAPAAAPPPPDAEPPPTSCWIASWRRPCRTPPPGPPTPPGPAGGR